MMTGGLAAFILRLCGWQAVFTPPSGPKSVVLVYPHTTNWDFPLGILFRDKFGLDFRWAGKDTLFHWPLRGIFIWLGGVPINRRERTGAIAQLTREFVGADSFHFCIAPEGTRSKTDHWKTGFYRLALAAQVPVGLGYIDYGRKCLGIECWITLTGDETVDLARIAEYYADKRALYPEKAGDIRFKS